MHNASDPSKRRRRVRRDQKRSRGPPVSIQRDTAQTIKICNSEHIYAHRALIDVGFWTHLARAAFGRRSRAFKRTYGICFQYITQAIDGHIRRRHRGGVLYEKHFRCLRARVMFGIAYAVGWGSFVLFKK